MPLWLMSSCFGSCPLAVPPVRLLELASGRRLMVHFPWNLPWSCKACARRRLTSAQVVRYAAWRRFTSLLCRLAFKRKLWHHLGRWLNDIKHCGLASTPVVRYTAQRRLWHDLSCWLKDIKHVERLRSCPVTPND